MERNPLLASMYGAIWLHARSSCLGEIETLPSDSLRVRVYAGVDPITGKRVYLTEVIPAGKTAENEAKRACTRLQSEVDERRNPRTKATVHQLMERYLGMLQVEDTTRASYERLVRLHIGPLLLGTSRPLRADGTAEPCRLHAEPMPAGTGRSTSGRGTLDGGSVHGPGAQGRPALPER